MPIFIYNSLTRKKEEFLPLTYPRVNIYTCGVTVYDDCHIGHARSLYIFDLIPRYLRHRGFVVNFTRNITDIDDKIINRAAELKISWQDLVKRQIEGYDEDLKLLGIEKADFEPRATENIVEMIKYIDSLIKKDCAYITKSGVYFSVRKFKDYGKLSGQSLDQMEAGTRLQPQEEKNDPLDFALWKSSKSDEPSWDSPWGPGRPGWHIECSLMSQKFLQTETLDIHAGGRDLIFPHHENEIAQAQSLTGKLFAKYWIHHGLLTINGQKMSKSLGNFVTIKDFAKKYHSLDILKLFFLSAHYSHPLDYNENKIEEARQALERIFIFLKKIKKAPICKNFKVLDEIEDKFINAMDDDFNAPQALACIFDLVSMANKRAQDSDFTQAAKITIEKLLAILGISSDVKDEGILIGEEEIEVKIRERDKARKEKNFVLADKIRKELEGYKVILEDTKDSSLWRRKL